LTIPGRAATFAICFTAGRKPPYPPNIGYDRDGENERESDREGGREREREKKRERERERKKEREREREKERERESLREREKQPVGNYHIHLKRTRVSTRQ
jgi:hypothetical protein